MRKSQEGAASAPRKDWPLRDGGNGQWVKTHKGKRYYFGVIDDWRGAEESYARRWPSIIAGLGDPDAGPDQRPDTMTLETLAQHFLTAKRELRDRGAIAPSTYVEVYRGIKYLLDFKGWRNRRVAELRPKDFATLRARIEDDYGPDGQKHAISHVRSLSKYGDDNRLAPPFHFGNDFSPVRKADIRAARRANSREHGEKFFPREQIAVILAACNVPQRAMFLLALNCGYTAADINELRQDEMDLDRGVIDYDRVKTGVYRFAYLWPQTVEAIRAVIAARPAVNQAELCAALEKWEKRRPTTGKQALKRWETRKPDWEPLVFLSRWGRPYIRVNEREDTEAGPKVSRQDSISNEFTDLLERLDKQHPEGVGGIPFKRKGVSFAAGRHTYYSAARRIDKDAARFIMGHADDDMGAWYDHLDDDKLARLKEVADGCWASFFGDQTFTNAASRFRLRLVGDTTTAAAV
jgi:hypothetical protein